VTNARILVVDDSPTIRRVIDQALSAAGHAVIQNANGASALEEAGALDIDVMILDFLMPEMNGYQVIKSMIQDPHLCDIPVILMCTRADDIPVEALSGLELLDILPKPFSPHDLQSAVETILEKSGRQRKNDTTLILELPDEDQDSTPNEDSVDAPKQDSSPARVEGAHDKQQDGMLPSFGGTDGPPVLELIRLLAESLDARGVARAEEVASAAFMHVQQQTEDGELRSFIEDNIGFARLHQPLPCLHGDLAAVPLPEVLQLLKLQGQTGILNVSLNRARFELGFRRGRIIWVRARNIRGERRLGQYFLKEGVLTLPQLDQLLAESIPRQPLGQLLLQKGLAQRTDIKNALRCQAQDLLYELLRAERGVFSLRELDGLPEVAPEDIGFSVDDILFSALRKVNETRLFRSIIPNMDTCCQKSVLAIRDGLNGMEKKVLDAIPVQNTITVGSIASQAGLTDDEVTKYLYRLAILRRVMIVDKQENDDSKPTEKRTFPEAGGQIDSQEQTTTSMSSGSNC
jgi:CheY-like chemotaxis protein